MAGAAQLAQPLASLLSLKHLRVQQDHCPTVPLREHLLAQLLDPDEQALIATADPATETFRRLEANPGRGGSGDRAMKAVESIIDFKTAAAKGIETSQIQSIIHPALADHVRREAVRFKDELERAV